MQKFIEEVAATPGGGRILCCIQCCVDCSIDSVGLNHYASAQILAQMEGALV